MPLTASVEMVLAGSGHPVPEQVRALVATWLGTSTRPVPHQPVPGGLTANHTRTQPPATKPIIRVEPEPLEMANRPTSRDRTQLNPTSKEHQVGFHHAHDYIDGNRLVFYTHSMDPDVAISPH